METHVYELTVVLSEDASEEKLNTQVTEWLKKSGGEVKKFDFWGRKPLSYPIKKKTQAVYGYFELEMDPAQARGLEGKLCVNEELLRYLLVIKNLKEAKKRLRKK